MAWILLTLFYGLVKGAREIVKKKALEISTVMEVLFFYTLLGFMMLLPDLPHVWGMSVRMYALVAVKSFVIFIAWLCGFRALKRIPLSVYGILDLSRVLFSTLLGVIVIGERPGALQIAGMALVAGGLTLLGFEKRLCGSKGGEDAAVAKAATVAAAKGAARGFRESVPYFILLAFISAFLNAVSGTMDKLLTREVSSGQLQFWYMLFLLVLYGLYLAVSHTPVDVRRTVRNYWIWILSTLFIVADRALFIANAYLESKVSVMTLVKQAGVIVTILAGRIFFHERGVPYKLLCAGIIILGIVLGAM